MSRILISYELDTKDIPTLIITEVSPSGERTVLKTIQGENGVSVIDIETSQKVIVSKVI